MMRLGRCLAVASLALAGVGAMASAASAREADGHHHFSHHHGPHTYVVTTLAASGTGSLAAAIERANDDRCGRGERDSIVFAVAGTIEVEAGLPTLTAPVDLDATTAPGYAPGVPVVELAGEGTGAGLTVGTGASGSRIAGLAITGFETGIVVEADGTEIAANLIARNSGAGIRVEPGATETTISANSIFDNGAPGIEVPPEGGTPTGPELKGFIRAATATSISGTLAGEPEVPYALEFFASEACAPSGQGQTFLGALTVTTGEDGSAEFEATELAPLPAEAKFISATATGGAGRSTSEFSACIAEPEPVTPVEPPAPPVPPAVIPAVASSLPAPEAFVASPPPPAAIVPINGETITIEPKTGKVRVKAPGDTRFRPITELESVPIGSLVDATEGKARIASASAAEEVQSAAFFGGVFRVLQSEGRTLTTMRLFDAEFDPCAAPSAEGATASVAHSGPNKLWGSGKGSFRTEGNFGSATVRGTIWLVADRCRSTYFKVNRGIVSVRDFPRARTISLRAGNTYTAAP
jgi:hypothetical protein